MNKVHAITLQCAWVMTCAYSPSGGLVAAGGLDNICSVYNLRAREQPLRTYRQLHGHTGFISCVRFLNDRQLLTASGDTSCALWDIDSQARLLPFQEHLNDVMALAIAPDKNTFATGACDRAAKLWDVRTGRCVQSFTNPAPPAPMYGDVNAVAWFPTGHAFAAGSDDGQVRLFDIRAARELCSYVAEPPAAVTSVAFSNSGRLLFAGYDGTAALVWDTLRGERVAALPGHEARVSCVGVPPNGMAVATGSWDHKIRVWA
jgi:guanine nucleotide-binding protein G(I)/G(S)/G(T) subunit beta-1